MADLEDFELLYQPHTSAGRIPTEKGLRLYLDSLMESKKLKKEEEVLIRRAYHETTKDIEELLRSTSRVLSSFCKQAGVVLWPRLTVARFKHIQFIRLRPRQILVILISKSGLVRHSLLDWEEDISQDDLDKYSHYLNELFQDIPLGEVKQRILSEMQNEKVLFDQLMARALEISHQVFQASLENSDVYIEGQTNLLNNPEFTDVEGMRRILKAFEDKSRIIRLLDMALKAQNTAQIILGPESQLEELQEISLISSTYGREDTVLGVLGVIGPLRMDYARIVPVVEFTAKLLNQLLEEESCDIKDVP
jgi:heat-inducible transcriptional repressor